MSDDVVITISVTWVVTLFLIFCINWNNNSYRYSAVLEYLKTENCYLKKDTYNNSPRVESYCGESNDR